MADANAFEGYIRFRILDSIGCPGVRLLIIIIIGPVFLGGF